MSKSIRILSFIFAALIMISAVGCGNPGESESESGVSEPEYTASDYLKTYSDSEAMTAWLDKNFYGTDVPPVSFSIDSVLSTELEWKKTVGEPYTVTDYPDTDSPAVRTCTDIEYVCEQQGIKLVITLTAYADFPIVEYDTRLYNISDGNSGTLRDIYTVNAPVCSADGNFIVHYNQGSMFNATEYKTYTADITENGISFSNTSGLPTCEYLPFFNAEDTEGSRGVIAAVNWQGNWSAEFSTGADGLRVCAGQKTSYFAMFKGEQFKLPGIVLLFYKNGDWQEGQNIWRRWIIKHNLMRYTGRRDFTQNVYIVSSLPSVKSDIRAIKKIAESGLPKEVNAVFEYDAGWYDQGVGAWTHTGNWKPIRQYGEDGIKEVSDACREAGIGFCIWVEPERVWAKTEFGKKLGDNVIYLSANGNYMKSSQLGKSDSEGLVNYGKQEVQDAVVELIDGIIKTYGLTVYRQDFNTISINFWSAYDRWEAKESGIKRGGATEAHACEGYINAWHRIAELNPGIMFDSCAGGGRRNDLETMRFSMMHTKTDYYWDITSQQCQNFGAYSWYIFTGTGFSDMASNYDIRSRLTLSVGIDAVMAAENSITVAALKEWASMQKYLYKDFYQLSEYSLDESANIAMQFNDHENSEGMMVGYLRFGGIYDFVARGLDPDINYKVWEKDDPDSYRVMSGKALMTEGYTVAHNSGVSIAPVVLYERTTNEVTPFDRDAKISSVAAFPYDELILQSNDIQKITKLYDENTVDEDGVVFLCSDHDCSGGIYAIGKNVYDALPRAGRKTSDGWIWLNLDKVALLMGREKYAISNWGPGSAFDVRAYVKVVDGRHFLWLDNSYSFGDPGGGWQDMKKIRLTVIGSDYKSAEFKFRVCDRSKLTGTRDIQAVFYNSKAGCTIYSCGGDIFDTLPKTDAKCEMFGVTWTQVSSDGVSFKIPTMHNTYNCDVSGNYVMSMLSELEKSFDLRLWVGEKDGVKYMLMENSKNIKDNYLSDCWQLYWMNGKCVRYSLFYCYTGSSSVGIAVPQNLVNF